MESVINENDVKSSVKKLLKKKIKDSDVEMKFTEDIMPENGEDDSDG
jgi:hypothetical protein